MPVEEGKSTVTIVSDAVRLAAVPTPSASLTDKDRTMNSVLLVRLVRNLMQCV